MQMPPTAFSVQDPQPRQWLHPPVSTNDGPRRRAVLPCRQSVGSQGPSSHADARTSPCLRPGVPHRRVTDSWNDRPAEELVGHLGERVRAQGPSLDRYGSG